MRKIKQYGMALLHAFSRSKIVTQYFIILSAIFLIFLVSFFITDWIARGVVKDESMEYSRRGLYQAKDRIDSYCVDLENVAMSVVNNPILINFMASDTSYERIWLLKDLSRILTNAKSLKPEIKLISLYDANNRLFGSQGTVFAPKESGQNQMSNVFDGPISIPNEAGTFFSLAVPVYDLVSGLGNSYLGICYLVVDASELEGILELSLSTMDSYNTLSDRNGNIILSAGAQPEEAELTRDTPMLIEELDCAESGWRLTGITPEDSMFSSINLLQQINYITYVTVFLILLLLAVSMYVGMIKPVRHQVAFMQRHPDFPEERMKVKNRNEIGVLSENLNAMLDNIDRLSTQNQEAQARFYESEFARRQTELLAYRNQINPHFLYNTFECIRGMALYRDAYEIADLTEALSNLYRYSVRGTGVATIEEELSYVREYGSIIKHRFMGKHTIDISVDKSLLSYHIPKMLIQPIIENAVFHGLEQKLDKGEVKVLVERDEECGIRIKVSDNGIGMTREQLSVLQETIRRYDDQNRLPEEKDKNNGIGLMNVYRRLKLFYQDRMSIEIQSEEMTGTTVIVKVPDEYEMGQGSL